jgi:hypothetical protein
VIHPTVRSSVFAFAVAGTGLALVTGCSSPSSSVVTASATPTQGVTASATPTQGNPSRSDDNGKDPKPGASSAPAALGECNDASLLAALPAGSIMDKGKWQCALASPTMWAAVPLKPGPTVYFLQTKGGPWTVSKADQVCGAKKSGLPPEIRSFCPKS